MSQKRLRDFGSIKDTGMSLFGIGSVMYEMTKHWHPLYNIILFTLFGLLYLRKVKELTYKKALLTGVLWSGISIVIDLFGWVIIKHPWSLTFKQFYVEYQPWIVIIYLMIFLAPVVSCYFLDKKRSQAVI